MKNLKNIEDYLNESLNEGLSAGKFNTESGMGVVTVNKTEDGEGFSISIMIEGSVRDSDLDSNAKTDLHRVANEVEKMVLDQLPWLQ